MSDIAGDQAGQQRFVSDDAYSEHLKSEQGACKRSTEYGSEAAADAAHQYDFSIKRANLQQPSDSIRQAATHLHCGAFSACRPSE
ncbi:hypothetical protein D3C78_1293550 [compost metagenome]